MKRTLFWIVSNPETQCSRIAVGLRVEDAVADFQRKAAENGEPPASQLGFYGPYADSDMVKKMWALLLDLNREYAAERAQAAFVVNPN